MRYQIYSVFGSKPRSAVKHLTESDEVKALAEEYIRSGALTKKNLNDCLHIAYAVVNDCDIILSWNFDHTRDWTKGKVKEVNATNRYKGANCKTSEFARNAGARPPFFSDCHAGLRRFQRFCNYLKGIGILSPDDFLKGGCKWQ